MLHPDRSMYTFWDYKRNRWPRDAGLRIDYLLLNREAAKRLVHVGVDREVRSLESASDHAPAWIVLSDRRAVRKKPHRDAPKRSPAKGEPKMRGTVSKARRPLLVIDGNSFAHRSFHALPKAILVRDHRPAPAEVRARYGVDPTQVPDFIALRGERWGVRDVDDLIGAATPHGAAG